MESLYNRYRDEGLEIVAVNIRESREQVQTFMVDYGLSFPALLDTDGRVSIGYGVQAIPSSFIIAREGQITARLVGSIDWAPPEVRAAFESLLR
jgi:peroxiredoxin